MIDLLTPIWQRVLQRSSIQVQDNFFDLGGDPLLATKLFIEVAQICGRELSPVMIYHVPTIAAMAAMLEQPSPRLPPLVLLKAGSKQPPVFIANGMGGSIMEFFQLVKHIRLPHPIYGMHALGIDGIDMPFGYVEDMVQVYLEAIKDLQPHGPYLLVGYSLGGLVVLEMAQRLSASGEKVALLTMLDSYPHIRYMSLAQRIRRFLRVARHHNSAVMQLPVREVLSYVIPLLDNRFHFSADCSESLRRLPPIDLSYAAAMQRVRDSSYLALRRYRPRFYSGQLKFVRAEISTKFPYNPAAVWANLVDELQVETVPGDHWGIISTHYEKLASVLTRYLEGAVCQE